MSDMEREDPQEYPVSPWMTKKEAAHHLRVSVFTIDDMLKDGRLTKHNIGGKESVRVSRAEVEALIQPVSGTP